MGEHHGSFVTSVMEANMKKRWKEKLISMGKLIGEEKNIEKKLTDMSRRMHFNISSIGRFMRLAAFDQFTPQQAEPKYLGKMLYNYMRTEFVKRVIEKAED